MTQHAPPPELVCPKCQAPLSSSDESRRCTACSMSYACTLGMPVFYPEHTGSRARLTPVLKAYPGASWLELLPLLHPKRNVPEQPAKLQRWAEQRILRHERFYEMFRRRAGEIWPEPRRGIACEIGCGRGDGLPSLARDFDHVIGLDVDLPSLVGAAKLVAERKLSNVTLVQASAHELPFGAGVFDYVQAINVIEHVFRPDHFFSEIKRVLAPDGVFCGDSRNRFDPFFPEPHVKLMWVGFLPRPLIERYVRLRKGAGYGNYLLSYFELQRALSRNFGSKCRVALPDISVYSARAPAALSRAVERAHAQRNVERALLPIFPTHIALARA
jgi:ubiquinone/menaquinone biosynthesis C-methylase UbiE